MGREGGSEGWRWHVAQKEDEKDWLSRLTDQHTAAGRAARGLACGADEKDRKEVRGGGVCRTTIDYFTMISHALRRATIVRGGGGVSAASRSARMPPPGLETHAGGAGPSSRAATMRHQH